MVNSISECLEPEQKTKGKLFELLYSNGNRLSAVVKVN